MISLTLYTYIRIPYRFKIERKEILNNSTIKINCRHLTLVDFTLKSIFLTSNDLQKFPSKMNLHRKCPFSNQNKNLKKISRKKIQNPKIFVQIKTTFLKKNPTSNFFSSKAIFPARSPWCTGWGSAVSCCPLCIARVQWTVMSRLRLIRCLEQTLYHPKT